ncbi:MAG: motility protein A [Treponema sp.]|jgi:chemotaxis protein MotA|nr:motility protein A [Treponema sp.]
MDISTLIGIIGCFAMIVLGIATGSAGITGIMLYADGPSVLIVVVGSWFALMTFSSIKSAVSVFGIIGLSFKVPHFNERDIITKLMAMSEKARREGLLALEDQLEDLDDEFIKKGMRMVVDGTDAAIIRDLLENELSQMQGRHADNISIINMWGTLAPGLGMLGTVIGLIGMLANLQDKDALGGNMAVALVTTLYGSMMANLLMIPIAGKLKTQDAYESSIKEMAVEGILSIQAGDNPRILAQKLLSYLAPKTRDQMEKDILKD